MRRGWAAGAAIALALVAAGCGGDPEATPSPSVTSVAPSSAAPSSSGPVATPSATSAEPSPSGSSSPSPSPTPSRTPRASASPASTANGVYANGLSVSEDGALSYVPLRWYAGADAEARCAEKEVEPEGAWCAEYYYEEGGGRKAATLTRGTEVRLLNDDLKPVERSLTDLVTAIEEDVWPNYQIAVSGGEITRITQVFTP